MKEWGRCGAERSISGVSPSPVGRSSDWQKRGSGATTSKIASAWSLAEDWSRFEAQKSFFFSLLLKSRGTCSILFEHTFETEHATYRKVAVNTGIPVRFCWNRRKTTRRSLVCHIEKRGRVRSFSGRRRPGTLAPSAHVPGHRSAMESSSAAAGVPPGRALGVDHQQVGRSRVPEELRGRTAHRRQRDDEAGAWPPSAGNPRARREAPLEPSHRVQLTPHRRARDANPPHPELLETPSTRCRFRSHRSRGALHRAPGDGPVTCGAPSFSSPPSPKTIGLDHLLHGVRPVQRLRDEEPVLRVGDADTVRAVRPRTSGLRGAGDEQRAAGNY